MALIQCFGKSVRNPTDPAGTLRPDFPNRGFLGKGRFFRLRLFVDPVFGARCGQWDFFEDITEAVNALRLRHIDAAGHPPDFIPCAGGRMPEILPVNVVNRGVCRINSFDDNGFGIGNFEAGRRLHFFRDNEGFVANPGLPSSRQ